MCASYSNPYFTHYLPLVYSLQLVPHYSLSPHLMYSTICGPLPMSSHVPWNLNFVSSVILFSFFAQKLLLVFSCQLSRHFILSQLYTNMFLFFIFPPKDVFPETVLWTYRVCVDIEKCVCVCVCVSNKSGTGKNK